MTTVHTPTGPPKVRAAKSWDKLRRKPSWSQPSSPEEKDAVAAGKRSPDENRAGRSSNTHDEGAFAGAMAELKVSPPKSTAERATRGEPSGPPKPAPSSAAEKKPAETEQPLNERRSARDARMSSSAEPSSTASAPGADAGGEDGLDRGAAFEWLLQRQIEVEMTLREKKVASREDLEHVAETFRDLNQLFLELHAAAAELTAPPGKRVRPAGWRYGPEGVVKDDMDPGGWRSDDEGEESEEDSEEVSQTPEAAIEEKDSEEEEDDW